MFKKQEINKIIIIACLCGLITACSATPSRIKQQPLVDISEVSVKRAYIPSQAKVRPSIVPALIDLATMILIYKSSKSENGVKMVEVISNYKLQKRAMDYKINNAVSTTVTKPLE